jgi:multidrug efflux pump subunit AcrA (membrane-fusion protein)
VVPRVAIHERAGEGPMLYLADDQGHLRVRPVTLGPVQGDLVLVTAGLDAGERVVVSDLIPAIDGMKLVVTLDEPLTGRLRAQATGATSAQGSGQ